MEDLFVIRLVTSFIVGGVWISALTYLSERFGTKVGGAIAGVPATMVVALFFIGLTQSPAAAAETTTLIPLVLGVNAIFVLIYIALARKGFCQGIAGAIIFWFAAAYGIHQAAISSFAGALALYTALIITSYFVIENKMQIMFVDSVAMRYTKTQVVLRGIVGGFFIALAVLMTRIGGPLLGGIFATFPALTVALIVIAHANHGIAYVESLLKNFIIAGTVNVLIFVILVRLTFPNVGLYYGTLASFVGSLLGSYAAYQLINKKLLS